MTDMQLQYLAFAAVSIAILALGSLVYDWLFGYRDEVNQRISDEFGSSSMRPTEQTRLFKDLNKLAQQSDPDADSGVRTLERIIEQAGLTISVSQLISGSAIGAILLAGIAGFFLRQWPAVIVAFAVAFPIPLLVVHLQRHHRLNRLRLQLPDAFEMMSRTIRAGQTVTGAFQTVADDFEAPIADEFAWCFEQQNLGLPQEIALRDLAKRSGVTELQMLVVALLVQRQSGGSPVELLDNLAAVVRKRIELQEKIKTLTAEGRLQAAVLLLLPPILFAVISLIAPDYVSKLWGRPNLLIGIAISEMIGVLWIHRILQLEF